MTRLKWIAVAVSVLLGVAWAASTHFYAVCAGSDYYVGLYGGVVELKNFPGWEQDFDWRMGGRIAGILHWLPKYKRDHRGRIFTMPLWLPFATVALPCSFAVRRGRRQKPGHCRKCGYDLRGNVSGRCPECGEGT